MDGNSSVTLFRCPGGFALPSTDPQAIAVETLLRFTGAHFTKLDGPMTPRLEVRAFESSKNPGAASPTWSSVSRVGLDEVTTLVEANGKSLNAMLSDSQKVMALAIDALVRQRVFPAFVFATHSDEMAYANVIRKSVIPKVGSFWDRLRPSNYRARVLTNTGASGYAVALLASASSQGKRPTPQQYLEAALADASKAIVGIEAIHVAALTEASTRATQMLARSRAAASGSSVFILGTAAPSAVDALAFAAASLVFHADLSKCSRAVLAWQGQLQSHCPQLKQYAETVRMQYFEEYGATLMLRPIPLESPEEVLLRQQQQIFESGRARTLWLTGVFTLLYFIIANAEVLVDLLSDEEADLVEGDDSVAEAAPATEAPQ